MSDRSWVLAPLVAMLVVIGGCPDDDDDRKVQPPGPSDGDGPDIDDHGPGGGEEDGDTATDTDTVTDTSTGTDGTTDGGTDTNDVDGCSSSCECAQGWACLAGTCVDTGVPTYCCDSDTCPAGERCDTVEGGQGLCPCGSACDCLAGLSCIAGNCVPESLPVYCCSEPATCVSGAICEFPDGGQDFCP